MSGLVIGVSLVMTSAHLNGFAFPQLELTPDAVVVETLGPVWLCRWWWSVLPAFTAKQKEVAIEMAEEAISEANTLPTKRRSEGRLSIVLDQANWIQRVYKVFRFI